MVLLQSASVSTIKEVVEEEVLTVCGVRKVSEREEEKGFMRIKRSRSLESRARFRSSSSLDGSSGLESAKVEER